MAYKFTEEQEMFRDVARNFARKDVEPLANRIDLEERTPPELTKKAAELGLFGLLIPEKFGGTGANLTTACLVLEEIGKASPSFAGLISVEMLLCPWTVETLGTEEQCRRILPKSATGERLMAYSQSEPMGAVNTAKHLTKLTPDGNNWRLNGAKLFCTQGEGKTYIVMCRTSRNGEEGYGVVLVEQEAEGFSVAPYEDKLGWRGTNTGSISFDNMLVTPDNILGDLLTANSLQNLPVNQPSFIAHCAATIGGVVGMFDKTLEYVKDRELYGEPMYKLSPISDRLADVHNKIHAMRALLYSISPMYDNRPEYPDMPYGSICKSYICDTAFQCTDTLLQMWGGSGMMNSTGINRYFRDARVNRMAEGSTEAHNAAISLMMLGLDTAAGSIGGRGDNALPD